MLAWNFLNYKHVFPQPSSVQSLDSDVGLGIDCGAGSTEELAIRSFIYVDSFFSLVIQNSMLVLYNFLD